MKPMTKAARKRHLQTAGQECCPFCKVENDPDTIECEDLNPVEDGEIEQIVKCLVCGRRWMDVFRLVEVKELT